MTRREFCHRLLAAAATAATAAVALPPLTVGAAGSSGRGYPGRVRPLAATAVARPGRWAG